MEKEVKSLQIKLVAVQAELKAPKGQFNKFANFSYRSCEDILEALKPLLLKHGLLLKITDKMELIGDRYYIKATAQVSDSSDSEPISVDSYARESAEKKGMDAAQITGSASSYSRKYALNGLFLIDDTKDSDSQDNN